MSDFLRSFCDCGRRVRIVWSRPLDHTSRPILLVCGYAPDRRCTFEQEIPESAVYSIHDEDEQ